MAKVDVLATILKVPEELLREALAEVAKEVFDAIREEDKDDGR